MTKRSALLLALGLTAALGLYFAPHLWKPEKEKHRPSQAGMAFLQWGMARLFPDGQFHTEKYAEAMDQMRLEAQLRGDRSPSWEALGPKNIGGRTLCMAVNPLDTSEIWLGSASGGLWKTTTAGLGANAWQHVETGFPVLGVGAIAMDPSNPNVLYVGTGEVYNVENSAPNVAIRTTRGTYGIGILKTVDGGQTWTKCLDWGYGQLRGVQEIRINPLRPATVLAATTEGLLRSWDAGATWHTIHNKRMAVDLHYDPSDTTRIFVTHGSLDDQDVSGVYRSLNSGASFAKLGAGLPATYSGKTLLAIAPSNPSIIFASVGEAFAQAGLYKSVNGGNSWSKINSEDVCKYQGWYSHDIAVNPANPNTFVWVGIDAWKSVNGGTSVSQKTYWYKWDFGYVPAGGSEGPPDYVHADIHGVYYPTADPNKVYAVTDGGLFVSYDNGETWAGRNGGYQTQQFYANLGSSTTNPELAIGGMQDNSTAIYLGDPSWTRVLGGDGECAAVNPQNDQIMYGSSQYLNMYKSNDGGQSWFGIGNEITGNAAFNGPFEIAPSNPEIMYAGAQALWRSDDGGDTWGQLTDIIADGDVILTIVIHPENPDLVYLSTAPSSTSQARVYKVDASDGSAMQLTGLPNRVCMDLVLHPEEPDVLFAVLAGFNTQHVWRTTDAGLGWEAIDNGLPDVPTNSMVIDPATSHFYVGNDLGVWHSANEGESWELYSAEAPNAMLAMHLSIAPGNKLRVATYGLGVWQTDLAEATGAKTPVSSIAVEKLRPNPASDQTVLEFSLKTATNLSIRVLDMQGKTVWQQNTFYPAGAHYRSIPLHDIPAGTYAVVLESGREKTAHTLVIRH